MRMQFLRFLLTGGITTALQYAALWLGSELFKWPIALASGAGYLVGSVFSYLLSYFFTFGSKRSHMLAMPRFYLMVAMGWCINTGVMALLVDAPGWNNIAILADAQGWKNIAFLAKAQRCNKWVSQILATCLTLIWNFVASRIWVFKII